MSETTDGVLMSALRVKTDNRVTIPSAVRDEYGMVPQSLVVARLHFEDGYEQFQKPLSNGGTVLIPKRIRDKRGVEPGDYLDVELVQ